AQEDVDSDYLFGNRLQRCAFASAAPVASTATRSTTRPRLTCCCRVRDLYQHHRRDLRPGSCGRRRGLRPVRSHLEIIYTKKMNYAPPYRRRPDTTVCVRSSPG